MSQDTLHGTRQQKLHSLHAVYMQVYGDFAADTRDIAEEQNISMQRAYGYCVELENIGLFCGDYVNGGENGLTSRGGKGSNAGNPIMWQCWQTYDSIDWDEAEQLFREKYPDYKPVHNAQESPQEPFSDDEKRLLDRALSFYSGALRIRQEEGDVEVAKLAEALLAKIKS